MLSSENSPSSNTSKNSAPPSRAWMLCGMPLEDVSEEASREASKRAYAGKNQTSPLLTSSTNDLPSSLTAWILTLPLSINAHSAATCCGQISHWFSSPLLNTSHVPNGVLCMLLLPGASARPQSPLHPARPRRFARARNRHDPDRALFMLMLPTIAR